MPKTAVFPGTFDPFTLGHQHIAERALLLCDKLVIAIGENILKQPMFSVEERRRRIVELFSAEKRIETTTYSGLTIDFCMCVNATIIIRGIRSLADCQQEIAIAQVNRLLAPSIETIFLLAQPSDATISSTAVREILQNNGSAAALLPQLHLPER